VAGSEELMADKGRPGPDPRPETEKVVKLSISLPYDMVERLRALARDDRGRDLRSGISGVLREFAQAELGRRARRQAKQEAAA
jgi:hypothetical protein